MNDKSVYYCSEYHMMAYIQQEAHGPHRSPEQQCLIIKNLELSP